MKTSELVGKALDWAVAKCEGRTLQQNPMGPESGHGWWIWEETPSGTGGIIMSMSVYLPIGPRTKPKTRNSDEVYSPSTDWAQGGPIIERDNISLLPHGDGTYEADVFLDPKRCIGPTPLIAAMRCYVSSKLGEGVEIPKGLL